MMIPLTVPARKYRLDFLLCCGTALYFFANMHRVAIPGTLFDLLQIRFHASAAAVTALGAVFMYVYAISQLFVGLLVDRYGGVRMICGGGIMFCAGSFLFSFSDTLPMLYSSRVLLGLGASTFYLSLIKETIRTFPKSYGIMISFVIMTGYLGGIMASAPFAGCVEMFGLFRVMFWTAVLSFLFYLLFCFSGATLKLPPVQVVSLHPGNFLDVMKIKHNRHIFFFSGINFGLFYVIQTVIGKKFLEDFCRIPPLKAAWILSTFGIIAAISGFLLAVVSRKYGNRRRIFCRIAGWVCLFVFTSLSGMILLGFRSPLLSVFLYLLATTASMSTITIPLLKETNETRLTGTAIAFMNFSFYVSVAVFGNIVGLLLNVFPPEKRGEILIYPRESYLLVFGALSLFALIAAYHSMRISETFGRRIIVS